MDSDKRGTMSVTIAIFSDSVLGNTTNNTAGFGSTQNTLNLADCDRISAILSMVVSMVVFKASILKPFSGLLLNPLPPQSPTKKHWV